MNNGKKNNSLENVIVKPTKDYETVGVKTKKKKQNYFTFLSFTILIKFL